jgi:hypothetical protein
VGAVICNPASVEADLPNRPWSEDSWVAVDDRVRGGSSQSYLDCSYGSKAVFHGNLDINTLGGAGFASQRTADSLVWDLSGYGGIMVGIGQGDGKKYTLTLKDQVLPKRPDGREQSTISWEYDFTPTSTVASELFVAWESLQPTYRGKPSPDAKPLDLRSVRRISLMMRRCVYPLSRSHDWHISRYSPTYISFFGEQEGPFRLEMECIAATRTDEPGQARYNRPILPSEDGLTPGAASKEPNAQPRGQSWRDWFRGLIW